ncbi:MAG: hypothetical protein ACM3IJ_05475 [Candidatus Levyibacteriota bacterium]
MQTAVITPTIPAKRIFERPLKELTAQRSITAPSFGARNFWTGLTKAERGTGGFLKDMYTLSFLHDFWTVLSGPVR